MLQARMLSKRYKKPVLREVSIQIPAGTIMGLLGPNGAGKTTCFYALIGLIRPDAGSVLLDDRDITTLALHQRAALGLSYLPQESSIFRSLSVRNNILAILELQSYTAEERFAECERLLQLFSLHAIQHSLGISLSGGERRRVEIARALATRPRFILLDEPFAGVDPLSIADIKNHILTLHDLGIGVLITDHNVRETLSICHQASIFHEGSIVAQGSPSELLCNSEVRRLYLGEDFSL